MFLALATLVAAEVLGRHFLLLLPFLALLGAVQTAFDASYLIFSRHFAAALELRINGEVGSEVLVGHHLEDTYLFPLGRRKVVTVAGGNGFAWFGFVTIFYTILGLTAYSLGLTIGLPALEPGVMPFYLVGLLALTGATLAVGVWWFVGGTGEERLLAVLTPWTEGRGNLSEPDP
ncbi:hypothetical protein BH23ACT5_BH23ACT5_04410 [soil metagenome]